MRTNRAPALRCALLGGVSAVCAFAAVRYRQSWGQLKARDASWEQAEAARLQPLRRYSDDAIRQLRAARPALAGAADATRDWSAVVKGLQAPWSCRREPVGEGSPSRWRFACAPALAEDWPALAADVKTLVLRDPASVVDLEAKAEGSPPQLAVTLILLHPDDPQAHPRVN